MAEFILIKEDFFIPLKDDDDGSLFVKKDDIIEIRYLRDDTSIVKKIGDLEFLDCVLYHEFIVANYQIFEVVTKAYIRERKINSLLNKKV